jgi:uncharacterized ferritin-like protein (DUF455 family)
MTCLAARAAAVLNAPEPDDKVTLSRRVVADWRGGSIADIGSAEPPAQPARPALPEIKPPGQMPRRGPGGSGKATLIHALAHIEFNAIDLAYDMIARFAGLPETFYADWIKVAADETEHFVLLRDLLRGMGQDYGSFPAHGGLWEAAEKTAHDLLARLALVPLTLEARAIDTAPPLMAKLRQAKDETTLAVIDRILTDEIDHVAIGMYWFEATCRQRGEDPASSYHRLVGPHFPKGLKPPFNVEGRSEAGMPGDFYQPLVR